MEQPARNYNKGFTLIEMMFSIVIIMITMLALLTSITVGIKNNMQNEIRNTAIRLATQTAEALISLNYNDTELSYMTGHVRITGNTSQTQKGIPDTVQTVRNAQVNYSIQWDVIQPPGGIAGKQINIHIGYLLSNQTGTQTHDAVTYKTTESTI